MATTSPRQTREAQWEQDAEIGDVDAMVNLGRSAHEADSKATAWFWWEKAAAYGNDDAMFELGTLCHDAGDKAQARIWWEKAAEHNHTEAMLALGHIYFEDDVDQTRNWWERAADLGDTAAMVQLGTMEKAIGEKLARRWWSIAAASGEETATELLDLLDGTSSDLSRHRGDDADPEEIGEQATGGEFVSDGIHRTAESWGPLVAKRAGNPMYRDQLLMARYDPHIAPFNRYVDRLEKERGQWLPYLAPTYGGVDARLLSLFQDPGPMTQVGSGTGLLCVENPDDTAARYLSLLNSSGIDVADTVSWNAYPWYLGRQPTDAELEAALPVLASIIELMPRLEVVLLHGVSARTAWAMLRRSRPDLTEKARGVIETYHTSLRVIEGKSPEVRARREKKLSDDFAHAKVLLEKIQPDSSSAQSNTPSLEETAGTVQSGKHQATQLSYPSGHLGSDHNSMSGARQMQWCSDEAYVQDLRSRSWRDPHVAPLNQFVDELSAIHPDRFVPRIAPTFGGTNARLLALFQDPGLMTSPENGGSGMLCIDNDDETSARHKAFLTEYKIDTCDVVTWNAYPWFGANRYASKKNRTTRDDIAATRSLSRFLSLLPNLEVVMLHGVVARDAWARLEEYTPLEVEGAPPVPPGWVHTRNLHVIDSWHMSPAVVDPKLRTAAQIEKFTREIHESFAEATSVLRRYIPGGPYDPPF